MPDIQIENLSWLPKAWEALVILIVGFGVSRGLTALTVRGLRFLDPQASMVLRKLLFYSFFGAFFGWALNRLGVDFKVLVGAAGVFSVAIGFASQTSASNLISGIFLIVEKPFVVGDWIRVSDVEGFVLSIDLLSTRIRTFDNLMVRIPNETLMKSNITNITRFPIRRADLLLGVSYSADLEKVRSVLLDVAQADPLCLDEPVPQFYVLGFGDSSVEIKFGVWTSTDAYQKFKTDFHISVKKRLDAEGIEIPFPQRTLHMASASPPNSVAFN